MATLYEAARAAGIPFKYEAKPVKQEFDTGEVVVNYLTWGNGNGPPIVLLHGWAQNARSWDYTALSLCEKYTVISVDARGHGDSTWATDGDYSAGAHQRDLDALFGHLDIKTVILIGFSMGGRSAYMSASRRPDLVKALGIVDAGPINKRTGGQRIEQFVRLTDQLDSIEEFIDRIRAYNPRRSQRDIKDTLIHKVRQRPDGKWTWKYDPALRNPDRRPPPLPAGKAWKHLEDIKCPTLLVRGKESDVLATETADEMVTRMRDCTMVEVDGAGHMVAGDNPRTFIKLVKRWLDKVSPLPLVE